MELLVETINSVHEFMKVDYEIIVVDNASSDNTIQVMASLFSDVTFIENKINVGFSAANNQGFSRANGKYVLLLNPDAKLIDDHILLALKHLGNYSKSIIGPKLLNPDLSWQDSIIKYPTFVDVFEEAFFMSYFLRNNSPENFKVGYYALSGACLFLPAEIYRSLNGLDEDLFWMDDVDFCFRAKNLGIETTYFPEWSVIHVIGQSSKKNYKLSISNQLISKLKFFRKHKQVLNFLLSVILIQIHILLRIIVFLPIAPFRPLYRLKFSAYCYSQSLFLKYIFTGKNQTF